MCSFDMVPRGLSRLKGCVKGACGLAGVCYNSVQQQWPLPNSVIAN